MILVNIGCGGTYHQEWQNFDLNPIPPSVTKCNLMKGLPLESEYADVVYHSHLLEHFNKYEGENMMYECFRVLKKGGTIRVVVPDLEKIARNYLCEFNKNNENDSDELSFEYIWSIAELYDQVTRSEPGGEIIKIIKDASKKQKSYIKNRIGSESFDTSGNDFRVIRDMKKRPEYWTNKSLQVLEKVRSKFIEIFLFGLGGNRCVRQYRIGKFRTSGENHLWMYDKLSLKALFKRCGFCDIEKQNAFRSKIPQFSIYELDVKNDEIRKPDSLYMEAVKP